MTKKYSIYEKKKMMYTIKKINNNDFYNDIYNLIKNQTEFTKNNNGVFFDFNKLSDNILKQIDALIIFYNKQKEEDEKEIIEFVKYSTEEFTKIDIKGNRLNNIEKQFLRLNKKTLT